MNACELTLCFSNLQMIESVTGNEDVGKWKCAVRFFCSLDMQLSLAMTQLGTEL